MRYVNSKLMRAIRSLALALPLALIAPMVVQPGTARADVGATQMGEDGEKNYDFGLKVRIELRMEDGTTVKHRGDMRTMGMDWRFEFDGADHHHVLVLNAEGKEGDKVMPLTLSYERDGMDVIAPYKSDWKTRKRETLWTTDGKLAIALTLIPYKFEHEDKSRDDKDKIIGNEGEDDDDPLGGNLFN